MANISDMIEDFIIDTLGEDEQLDISRNELASFFNVAPSQINYVLSTRFTYARGFLTESKRGGGGHITILRAADEAWDRSVVDRLKDPIDYKSACYIIDELCSKKKLNTSESQLLKAAISPMALSNPFKLENQLRSQILRRILFENKGRRE